MFTLKVILENCKYLFVVVGRMQLLMAFAQVKSGYKRNQVSALSASELRSMSNIACGMTAAEIALIDPTVFWYVSCAFPCLNFEVEHDV